MYLKKKATVLISTSIILSLMSMLGFFMYKLMKNNNELSYLYNFDKDIYDLDEAEEEILNKFMKEINENINSQVEENNNSEVEENNDEADIFSKCEEITIEGSNINYSKNDEKLFLETYRDKEKNRKREIEYFFRNKKIVLVPTYKFKKDT
jgi:hypothetical protein